LGWPFVSGCWHISLPRRGLVVQGMSACHLMLQTGVAYLTTGRDSVHRSGQTVMVRHGNSRPPRARYSVSAVETTICGVGPTVLLICAICLHVHRYRLWSYVQPRCCVPLSLEQSPSFGESVQRFRLSCSRLQPPPNLVSDHLGSCLQQ